MTCPKSVYQFSCFVSFPNENLWSKQRPCWKLPLRKIRPHPRSLWQWVMLDLHYFVNNFDFNQINDKEVVMFHFCLRWVHHVISEYFFLNLTWKSESLVAKILKQSMDIVWSQKSIWFFAAVDFLDFDFFPVKGETPECYPVCQI